MKKSWYGLFLFSILFCSCSSNDHKRENKQARLYYDYGTNKLVQGQYTEALDNLLKAYQLTPKNPEVLNNLGMAYFFKDRPQKAFELVRQSLEINPDNTDALLNLASLHLSANQLDEAEALYVKVLDDLVYKRHFRTHFNLGVIELKRKNYRKAIEHFKNSHTVSNDYCPASFQLAQTYKILGELSSALTWAEESVKGRCIENPESIYQLAVIQKDLGLDMQARENFQNLVDRFSNSRYSVLAKIELANKANEESKKTSNSSTPEEKPNTVKTPQF